MDKLRVGVIGTGSVVREIYRHLYYHSEFSRILSIEAAADPNAAALGEFCDRYGIPEARRFSDYRAMIGNVGLDAVQVNTPDGLHEAPVVAALGAGLDALVPKPLADTVCGAHAMIEAARASGRLLLVDFHKRDDPRVREAAARYRRGEYGEYQCSVWYMLDKLMVADPNRTPRFFASPDFVERNSPISFLTVHMADALLNIVGLRPAAVRASAWRQKLASLRPIASGGYDMCDTTITFANGGVAHIVTGWHLPDGAHANTVQSARIICTDGMVDLGLDTPGYHELGAEGIQERNPLFRNFEADGMVSGYGISRPGRLYAAMLRNRQGQMTEAERARTLDPVEVGFWTTAVLETAEESLAAGAPGAAGALHGPDVDVADFVRGELGDASAAYLV
jgi:predicted dehydrogenase